MPRGVPVLALHVGRPRSAGGGHLRRDDHVYRDRAPDGVALSRHVHRRSVRLPHSSFRSSTAQYLTVPLTLTASSSGSDSRLLLLLPPSLSPRLRIHLNAAPQPRSTTPSGAFSPPPYPKFLLSVPPSPTKYPRFPFQVPWQHHVSTRSHGPPGPARRSPNSRPLSPSLLFSLRGVRFPAARRGRCVPFSPPRAASADRAPADVRHVQRPHELGVAHPVRDTGAAVGRAGLPRVVHSRISALAVQQGEVCVIARLLSPAP